jgi:uncharacterized protein (TIGR03435 family)
MNDDTRNLKLCEKTRWATAGTAVLAGSIAIGLVNIPVSQAQSSADTAKILRFEVASIKSGKPGSVRKSLLTDPNGRFATENATLRMLVTFAYSVHDFQVSGGPRWIDSDAFDIVAKPENKSSRVQLLQMVQVLLTERFKLRIHRETKEQPVLALVIGKNGPKLKMANTDDGGPMRGLQGGRGELTGLGADMGSLARRLSGVIGRVVIDRTGLSGKYDFKLQWTPDTAQPMRGPDEPVDSSLGSSILAAVQEQLGLKLEAQKGPVDMIVIDAVERPSAN